MQCPGCRGRGGETDVIDAEIGGPWEECGFCKGTGSIKNRKFFYRVLGWVSWEKRKKRIRHPVVFGTHS